MCIVYAWNPVQSIGVIPDAAQDVGVLECIVMRVATRSLVRALRARGTRPGSKVNSAVRIDALQCWDNRRPLETNASMSTEPRTPSSSSPSSTDRTARLRAEVDKLEAFCMVVRAASAAKDHAAFTEVSLAASQALHAKFGGGSITSVFAWLTGR